jgi:hypothetical protein
MKLSLEHPAGKQWVLFANELSGDAGYRPWDHNSIDWDAERHHVDRVVLGNAKKRSLNVFNQMAWEGTTGWEYWSDNYQQILAHALAVAEELEVPLHIEDKVFDEVMAAAKCSNLELTLDVAGDTLFVITSVARKS